MLDIKYVRENQEAVAEAMKNRNASALDGIVGHDPEASVDNLGNLCNTGMLDTDRVILDMLVCK